MGKKTSQSSEKISKKRTSTTCTCTDNKKTLNSLIRILKPKVYITDSSTFKSLVQQLTGNEMITTTIAPNLSSPPNYSSIISELADQQLTTTMIEEQYYATNFHVSSPEMSFDSSELITSVAPTTFGTSDLSQNHPLNMTSTPFLHHDQQFDQSFPPQYGDMDLSWLLENMDTPNFTYNYDSCTMMMPPEVSNYDYDMSGIM